jgi:hypothetical protein
MIQDTRSDFFKFLREIQALLPKAKVKAPLFSGLRGNPQSLGCGNSDRGFVSAQDGGMDHWTPMALPISENMKNIAELHLKEHEITNYSISVCM